MHYSTLSAAAQTPITRASLAEWDASARAWLRTADRVKVKQQDQLMLLIANLSVPINHHMAVYHSVITGWSSALEVTERLIKGMPQAGNSGPCLLALSAWHIYPDIMVAGASPQVHNFDDSEVQPGGVITLGLSSRVHDDARGVYWSLSLAHLRHYGRPVASEASLGLQSKRLTFDQFTQAVFGSFLGFWGIYGQDVHIPARFLVALRDALQREARISEQASVQSGAAPRYNPLFRDPSHGINILTRAAASYLDAMDFSEDIIHKLIALGFKRSQKLMPEHGPHTFLSFDDPSRVLMCLKGIDEQIHFLRRMASRVPEFDGFTIIKYSVKSTEDDNVTYNLLGGIASTHVGGDTINSNERFHSRWVPEPLQGEPHPQERVNTLPTEISSYLGSSSNSFTIQSTYDAYGPVTHRYELLYGNPKLAAIYIDLAALEAHGRNNHPRLSPPTIEDLIWCLNSDLFDGEQLLRHFDLQLNSATELLTLKALNIAYRIYRALPDARVSTSALNRPLYMAKWAKHIRYPRKSPGVLPEAEQIMAAAVTTAATSENWNSAQLNLKTAFACVANLEGGFDIDPPSLERVFAIAFEDSIYVSMQVGGLPC